MSKLYNNARDPTKKTLGTGYGSRLKAVQTLKIIKTVPKTKQTTTVLDTNPTTATSVSAIRKRIAFVLYESSKYAALVVSRGVNDTCAPLLCDAAVVPAAPLVQPVRSLELIPV